MTLDPALSSAFQTLLSALVIAVVTVLAFAVRKGVIIAQLYLEQKLGAATYDFLKGYVTTTVRFLEQTPIFKELTGPEKKDAAIKDIAAWCSEHKLPIDYDLINKLLEEAVNVMNEGQPPMLTVRFRRRKGRVMDLSGSWPYIERIARSRLAHNKSRYHVSEYGDGIETLGVAGEIAARRFLGLDEKLHEGFDGGVDFVFAGCTIDVKATVLTPNVSYRFLQWPEYKPVIAQIILLTGIEPLSRRAVVLGYATQQEVRIAPINTTRFNPCHEIAVSDLHPYYELISKQLRIVQGGMLVRH